MNVTTSQLETAAVGVPCPEHQVGEGIPCPNPPAEAGEQARIACLTRRSLASARAAVAGFPRGDELDSMTWRDLMLLATRMRDASRDLSNCLDVALQPFGVA
jgi:hypothetical protein